MAPVRLGKRWEKKLTDKKPSKFRNKPQVIDGYRFASQKEARRYAELSLMLREGEITSLRIHPTFVIEIFGMKVCTYIADFSYYSSDGVFIVEDVKGVKTDVYKLKKRLMFVVNGIGIVET